MSTSFDNSKSEIFNISFGLNKEVRTAYASFWQRLLAHNIDLILLLGLFYLYSLIPGVGFDAAIYFLIYVFYYSIFELSNWKATPGKKWTKLKVVNHAGRFGSLIAIPLRNTTKIISLILFFAGFAMINFNKKKQGLHDFIAGTVVQYEEELA